MGPAIASKRTAAHDGEDGVRGTQEALGGIGAKLFLSYLLVTGVGVATLFLGVSYLAHNVKHLFGEGQNAIPVISDPFGWGWNLFGTAKLQLSPAFSTDVLTTVQFALILLGQGFAVYVAYRIGHRLFGARAQSFLRGLAPILVMTITWSIFNLWVLNMPLMHRH